jgi:flagellar biosynthesis protein FlhG
LASFEFDQAEGLRRMLAGPKPRVFTVLSATPDEDKGAMLVNLGASLAQAGSNVLLFDARSAAQGISSRLDAVRGATLLQVARQERALDEVVQTMPQGFGVAALTRGAQRLATDDAGQARRLAKAFGVLATRADIVVADAELDDQDALPMPALANGEIVIQVSASAASIKSAYAIIKRVNGRLGRRPFSVLVTGANEKEAQVVFRNMAQAANRYLAVKLNSIGSVPADDHVKRAAHLGRPVVDAFPLARASVAFRRLAGQFALSDVPSMQLHGISAANFGI